MSSGSFTVHEIVTSNAGVVLKLDLTFRHICDNDVAVHTGRIHYEQQLTKATIDGPNSSRNGAPVKLTVTVVDPQPWWHAAQLAGMVFLAFLAVPFGRRESRVGRT